MTNSMKINQGSFFPCYALFVKKKRSSRVCLATDILRVFIFCIIDLLIDAKQTKPGSMVVVLNCADRWAHGSTRMCRQMGA